MRSSLIILIGGCVAASNMFNSISSADAVELGVKIAGMKKFTDNNEHGGFPFKVKNLMDDNDNNSIKTSYNTNNQKVKKQTSPKVYQHQQKHNLQDDDDDDIDWEAWETYFENMNLCYNESYTDCTTCMSTVLSDESESCAWSEAWGQCNYLAQGIDNSMNCDDAIDIDVTDYFWCGGCVESGGGWSGDLCFESCSDTSDICYSLSSSSGNSVEICKVALNDQESCWANDFTDCDTCTSTTLSDGSSCNWFPSLGWCDSVSTIDKVVEVGSSTCDDDDIPDDVTEFYWCGGCLSAGGSWVPTMGACFVESCSDIATDELCYSSEKYPNNSTSEICGDIYDSDMSACFQQYECGDCTNTILSDGISSCVWNSDWEYCDTSGGSNTCSV